MTKRIRILALSLAFGLDRNVGRGRLQMGAQAGAGARRVVRPRDGHRGSVLTGDTTPGARVLVTSDQNLDRDFDFAFDENARGVKLTIKRRGMRRLFSGWFRRPRHAHHDSGADANRRPAQYFWWIDQRRLASPASSACTRRAAASRSMPSRGTLTGTTSGGGIRMRTVRGNVVASTSGGSIAIADIRGSLRASTSGGGIIIDDGLGRPPRLDQRRRRGRARRRRTG